MNSLALNRARAKAAHTCLSTWPPGVPRAANLSRYCRKKPWASSLSSPAGGRFQARRNARSSRGSDLAPLTGSAGNRPSVGVLPDGRLEVFAIDSSGRLWHTWQQTTGGWSPGVPLADSGVRMPGDWTDGCIAVSNAEIEVLWQAIPDGTPIEIRP